MIQLGQTEAIEGGSTFGDTQYVEDTHARRQLTLEDNYWAKPFTNFDKARAVLDPTSTYNENWVAALKRKRDRIIIDALGGTARAGKKGQTSVDLPSSQKVAVDFVETGICHQQQHDRRQKSPGWHFA